MTKAELIKYVVAIHGRYRMQIALKSGVVKTSVIIFH